MFKRTLGRQYRRTLYTKRELERKRGRDVAQEGMNENNFRSRCLGRQQSHGSGIISKRDVGQSLRLKWTGIPLISLLMFISFRKRSKISKK